jgi:ATP-binding cassette subfamily F protein 2
MESIDALAEAINSFEGGVCVVSHDIRLISQVAKEIWLCDNGKITTYPGTIEDFKRDLQRQVEEGVSDSSGGLKGDGSKKATENDPVAAPKQAAPEKPISFVSSGNLGSAGAPPPAPPKGFEGLRPLPRKDADDDNWRR